MDWQVTGLWTQVQRVICVIVDRCLWYQNLKVPERVILGNGHCLDAVGRGIVELVMKLPGGKKQRCKLREVLFVPGLSYSLLSVSKASVAGKVTESGCQIFNADKVIVCASRCGSLYMLECEGCNHAYTALTTEDLWHRQYGHLGAQSLRQLSVEEYGTEVKGYRLYDPSRGGKVIYSRDVKFNEMEFGLEESNSVKSTQYVELEVSSSTEEPQESTESNADVSTGSNADESTGTSEDTDTDPNAEEVAVRRSGRVRQRPDYYMERVSLAQDGLEEPTTMKEALDSPQKVKTNEDGKVERYKARLVARGFTQVKGADYDETFCPVVRMESLRMLVAAGVQRGLQLYQVDVTTAFLNGVLEEEIFMRQPGEKQVKEFKRALGDRQSTSGYMLSGAGISWRSRKQTSVALSTLVKKWHFSMQDWWMIDG